MARGTKYSAMDGPGGPLLGGTTYSMTASQCSKAVSSYFIYCSYQLAAECIALPMWCSSHSQHSVVAVRCEDAIF